MTDVLLLDDDPLVLSTLAEALRDADLVVTEASTPDQALDALGLGVAPHVLVTDMHLGSSRDGRAVASEARRLYPNLPVVFITGRPDTFRDFTLDARQYLLAKPFRPSELIALVRGFGAAG